MRINQDSVAERTASIIDPEPLIHNYFSLTTSGLVLYEELNGSASHIGLNYLLKMCVWFCLRGNKERSAVTCGNMITFMAFSISYLTLMCVIILKLRTGLIDFLCIIN